MGGAAAAAAAVKRIPRIKFPQRHANSSSSGLCPTNSRRINRYRDSSFYHVKLRSSRITSQYC
ncbi:hypothetical protein OIU74_023637 [Salix koriyanagi]|uniref:Uncharacterized protein n=1 Tax=Salix koriyanagi TaxID=2511006 RepID=A0A9Q1ABC1_9ROSI|nr:hypothetical protein OIU74_023637 [Salix koriyanagi]